MAELLQIENLSAGYGEAVVLTGVSLSLPEGQTLALLGRNGTGKTTLMNTLAGATRQHAGSIRLGEGQTLALLGRNGTGKTTLINTLAGATRQHGGTIALGGQAALPADVSVLLIEHDMDLVFSFADRMTVLVNGTLLTEGDPDTIANDPKVKEVYLGHGAAHE